MTQNTRSVFCFFDETGMLRTARDPYFAVGMIKIQKPHDLQKTIQSIRDKNSFYDELKWSRVYEKNKEIYKHLIHEFYDYKKARFSCYIFKKDDLVIKREFKNDLFNTYRALAMMQIKSNLSKDEQALMCMDKFSMPTTFDYEDRLTKQINRKLERNAVFGVIQLDSRGSDLIQLADVILGGVIYEYKLSLNLIKGPSLPKKDVLKQLQKKSSIKSFLGDKKTKQMDVWNFKP